MAKRVGKYKLSKREKTLYDADAATINASGAALDLSSTLDVDGLSSLKGGLTVTGTSTLAATTAGGHITFAAGKNIITSGAGIKIGTATGQKVGFHNATPIIQQTTTSQTAATFAANTSDVANDSATWNGYTIGDVVAILQAYGFLA
jgi:hypothetical protein